MFGTVIPTWQDCIHLITFNQPLSLNRINWIVIVPKAGKKLHWKLLQTVTRHVIQVIKF